MNPMVMFCAMMLLVVLFIRNRCSSSCPAAHGREAYARTLEQRFQATAVEGLVVEMAEHEIAVQPVMLELVW